jgi:two-component system cell cycle sensor histidine kinase/response regulator CckA
MSTMESRSKKEEANRREIDDLRTRLQDAEETLRAIRSGEVDALVVTGPDGYQIFTLKGADRSYRIFVEAMKEGAATITPEGTILYCNGRFAEMLNYPLEKVIGSSIFDYLDESGRQYVAPLIEEGSAGSSRQEVTLLGHAGTRVPAYLSINALELDGADALCIVATDLTEQKLHEVAVANERRRAEEERLRANKLESVGILAGGLAHDFNNFLASILGNISLVKRSTNSDSELFERLTAAETACSQARNLTQQLLTFSKGGAPVKRTSSIAELLKESADFALRGSNVRSKFIIPDDLWTVEIDEGQISRVINNLVINAEQAMPEGGVVIIKAENVRINRDTGRFDLPLDNGRYVKITITDHGLGVPRENLDKIFDPYFTTKKEGSGLGLATSYSIIRNHHGHITVDSQPGAGTDFYIYLPASEVSLANERSYRTNGRVTASRALVMDDQEAIRQMLSYMLGDMGFEVSLARNGIEAIRMYREARETGRPYDVVLMDLTIPGGMGGKEAISALREIDPDVKALVLSGYSNNQVMSEFEKYGFSGVLPKPFDMDTLAQLLSTLLADKQNVKRNA